jgi:hypothetical protein
LRSDLPGLDAPEKEGFILKRFAGAIFTGALVVGGLVGMSAPAFAVTTFTQCSSVNGHATLSPGISNTHQSSHVTGTATIGGCVGGNVTGGSLSFQGDTIPGDCNSLANPTPGQVVITGTFSINWTGPSPGTSTGSLKAKQTNNPIQVKAITKITGGKFAGTGSNPTKGKVLVQFTPDPGQNCTTTPITGVGVQNVAGNKFVVASAH